MGVAATGEEAVRLLIRFQPDVVLIDIDLNRESGFDLARRVAPALDTTGGHSVLISTCTTRRTSRI